MRFVRKDPIITMYGRDHMNLHAPREERWTQNIYSASTCHFRTVRTRGSPFSLRLRSFSCRLLSVLFSPVDSSELLLFDEKPIMGAMKLLHILNAAYDGILGPISFGSGKNGSIAYQEVKVPNPFTERTASDLTRPYMHT